MQMPATMVSSQTIVIFQLPVSSTNFIPSGPIWWFSGFHLSGKAAQDPNQIALSEGHLCTLYKVRRGECQTQLLQVHSRKAISDTLNDQLCFLRCNATSLATFE